MYGKAEGLGVSRKWWGCSAGCEQEPQESGLEAAVRPRTERRRVRAGAVRPTSPFTALRIPESWVSVAENRAKGSAQNRWTLATPRAQGPRGVIWSLSAFGRPFFIACPWQRAEVTRGGGRGVVRKAGIYPELC